MGNTTGCLTNEIDNKWQVNNNKNINNSINNNKWIYEITDILENVKKSYL